MRLYLAAPNDLAAERRAVERVVSDVNVRRRSKGVAPIELHDWHSTLAPHALLPENVAFQNLDVRQEDVFVGLAWLAYDGPDAEGEVATERDVETAYAYWKTLRRPQALFFRCMRSPDSLDAIDPRAFDRVGLFHRRFDAPEKNRFAFGSFRTIEELEAALGEALDGLDGRVERPAVEALGAHRSAGEAAERRTTQFETKMQPGKAYEVSFLAIEIDRWRELAADDGQRAELQTLAAAFQQLVESTARTYGGELFSWSPIGGLVIFWARRSFDHAIMTGLKVLHNLPVFNLDPMQNPLGEAMDIRAAAHDAVIVFQQPIENIRSADVQFAVDLLRGNTEPGELTIPRRLLERIDERLRPHFVFKDRFEREPIYSCKLPTQAKESEQADLDDSLTRFRRQAQRAATLLRGSASSLDPSALDAVSNAVDSAYAVLNGFCQSYASIDYNWSRDFLERLAETAAGLRGQEDELWGHLRESLTHHQGALGVVKRLEAVVRAASRRRPRPVVILEKLEERCRSLAQGGGEPERAATTVGEEVLSAIDGFLSADELDNETRLTELLLHHKAALLDYVGTRRDDERYGTLMDKLWQAADLVLLDDLFSIRGHQRADEAKVSDALIAQGVDHRRFRLVRHLLGSNERPDQARLASLFERLGLEMEANDLQIICRCLVIGHGDAEIREAAALELTPQAMWGVVSHPAIPIAAICAIAERMSRKEGEDARKIFFDCTRSRIEQAVETFRTRDEFNAVTRLIMLLLGFSFLVETGYFERFDDILRRFLDRAQEKGLQV
ncbi:MAG: hypothetical protein AAGN46_16535, partial [Acidobacteriota bacterium]